MDTCEIAETYEGLRERVLHCHPTELGLGRVAGRPVWRVMMEIGSGEGATTLVVTDDGTLGLYTSHGELVELAREHWPHKTGARLIGAAGDVVFECVPTWAFPLPDHGKVRFYLFTFGGVAVAEALEAELAAGGAPLSPLFYAGHDVLTLARLVSGDDEWAAYEAALEIEGEGEAEDAGEIEDHGDHETEELPAYEPAGPERGEAPAVPTPVIQAAALPAAPAEDPAAAEIPAAAPQAAAPSEPEATTPAAAPSEPEAATRASSTGRDPLVQAVIDDDAAAVATLLGRGHGLAADSKGFTPLMAAAYVGAAEPLRLLLAAGAPVDAHGRHGFTALMCACNAGHADCARLLLEAGADLRASDAEGSSPLIFASQHGFDDIVRLLIERGADPTAPGSHGRSAIAFAAKKGHESTVAILLGQYR